MDSRTHASLLARLAEGVDPAAWAEFHDRYHDLIRGFAGRYGLQAADCDDVTQEVLLSLTRSMDGFEYAPARGKFRSYLKTMVINAILRRQRQERRAAELRREAEDPGRDAAPSAATAWDEEWRQYHVRRAMQRLMTSTSERDRIAFARYAMEGAPVEEVARELGVTVDLVYQIKSRILKRLRELIAKQVEEEG